MLFPIYNECILSMCGIAAFIVPTTRFDHRAAPRNMAAAIFHRGPDDEGVFEATTSDGRYRMGFPCVRSEVDLESVWPHFSYRYVPGPAMLFKFIRKLMQGSYAIWEECRWIAKKVGLRGSVR